MRQAIYLPQIVPGAAVVLCHRSLLTIQRTTSDIRIGRDFGTWQIHSSNTVGDMVKSDVIG